MPFRTAVLLTITILLAAEARAQAVVTPADRASLGVTVYQGFGMVRDGRRLPAGARDVVWVGVPRTVDPGTVILTREGRRVDAAALTVETEQGPMGVLAEGQPVVLVSPDGARIEAVVASPFGGLFRAGDRLIVNWQGHVEIPDPGRALDPASSIRWRLEEPTPGGVATASYLAGGLSWSADYVAVLTGEERMSLEGHATVWNRSGMGYPDARLQLVAGVVRRTPERPRPETMLRRADMEMAIAEPAPDVEREALEEYHLYTVESPVTLTPDAATRIGLLDAAAVEVERELVLAGVEWRFQGRQPEIPPEHPEIRLRFVNDRASGLGEPLPGGVIHAYRQDSGGVLQFVGDGRIPHTPAGERVTITIGRAFDVTARRTQTDWRRIDERTEESAWRIELRNAAERSREVAVVETFAGAWTVLEESRPHTRVDARTARWTIEVPAGGSAILTYRVRVTY